MGYSPCGHKELGMTEWLTTNKNKVLQYKCLANPPEGIGMEKPLSLLLLTYSQPSIWKVTVISQIWLSSLMCFSTFF